MIRKTCTILAVALTTSACGGVASEPTDPQPTKQELAGEELSNTPTTTPDTKPAPTSTTPDTKPPAPAAPPPPACDRDALNKELGNEMLESALARHKHFRCLCDDKGYPLVGNINSKGATASAFCGALKEKGLL